MQNNFEAYFNPTHNVVKGQTNSKLFFQANVSSKKTNKRIRLYYFGTSGRLVFVWFLEEIEDTKKTFRN